MLKKFFVLLLTVSVVILSGCWDRTEINELGFVLAVAIDPNEDGEKEENGTRGRKKKYTSTWQVAIPDNLSGGAGSGEEGQSFFNISSSDTTSFKTNRNISQRSSRRLFFEHLKTIIINEELAKEGLIAHLLDFYTRDHEMRRNMRVLISEGQARDILSMQVPLEGIPAVFIDDIRTENSDHSFSMLRPLELGEISSFILGDRSFLLSRIVKGDEDDLKVSGATVFSAGDNVMVGWIGEDEVAAYNLVKGESDNGVLEVPFEEEDLFVFEADRIATTINFERENEVNHFQINVKTEGMFGESWIHDVDINDEETFEKLEEAVEEEINRLVMNVIAKMQNEFYADIFKFWREVEIEDYGYWNAIKDQWDGEGGEFSKAKVSVTAEVELRHYMINESLE